MSPRSTLTRSTGQLLTKADLDEEDDDNYQVTVRVTDENPQTDDGTVLVMITVSNVNEPLPAPAPPTVTSGSNSTSLIVHWDAPDATGREPITGYDVEYKKAAATDYTDASHSGTGTRADISGLDAGTDYHVRVQAENAEGKGVWSLVGTGASNGENNRVPSFSGISISEISVPENTPAGQNIQTAITAADDDSTTLLHSIEGRDADAFDIVPSSGQILTKAPLNFEEKEEYKVLVKVDDGDGGSAVKPITIMVTDVTELPSAPGMPTVVAGEDDDSTLADDESTTTLKVTWDAPENTGPPITGTGSDIYTVEYRKGTTGQFNTVSATIDYDERSVTIASLIPDTSYQVRVKAHNGEGESPYSRTGEGKTEAGNRPPTFSTETTTRSIQENTPAGQNVGARVRATDLDGDTLTYSLDETGAATFDIDESTGQIKTKAALNYEAACGDENNDPVADESECTYSVTVKAEDEFGSNTIAVKINVTDRNEAPSAPQKPTVTSVSDDAGTADVDESTIQLSVSWHTPENMGPSISLSDYEVQYRVHNRGSYTSVSDSVTQAQQDGPISVKITGLTVHTRYEVQVRATNAEETGRWSTSGLGWTNTAGNALPEFPESENGQRAIDENPSAIINVGTPVTANDGAGDNDDRTYSMEGADADSFTIESTDGQIKTKAGVTYNHEAKSSYSVMVKAEDSEGGSATIQVNITIRDVGAEAPGKPAAPTVTTNEDDLKTVGLDESTSTLDVSWNEPANTGPSIDKYDVRYKIQGSSGSDAFTTVTCESGGNEASMKCFEDRQVTIKGASDAGLEDGTTYEVQVNAYNAESATSGGPWSDPGTGTTVEANNRPQFSSGTSATRSVAENTRSGQNVGARLTATDRDGENLTYTLEGPGKDSFTIDSRTGQIRTSAALDYESRQSYSVTVKADDGSDTRNSFAAISVTLMVNPVDEPPAKPAAPTVMGISGSSDSVLVMWEEPSNTGPPIIDYDLQYREGSSGNFRSWPHYGMDMSAIVSGLSASKTYQFQVLAHNEEGPSQWSSSGSGRPDPDPANNPPVYTGGVRNFRVEENSEAAVDIGTQVVATDPDDDTLSYSLEGADSASFEIVSVSGQIQTKAGVDYNYEAPKNSYSVTVRAADDRGGSTTVAVTIAVTDSGVDEPPGAPDAPTVAATSNSSTSLDVSWTAPENPGPAITDYDYQYKETSSSSWTVVDNTTITATSVTIPSLDPETSYDVQVRATNADDTSDWSGTGSGETSEPVANRAPVFSEGASTTRTVSENAQASSRIGAPVAATDADNDTLIYSLDGTDASSFDITSSAGQLLVGAGTVLDASTKATYSVTVVANDGTVTATIDVTITVAEFSDVAPSVPDAPTVSPNADSATSLDVSWVAPDNQGPPITDYDYRYRIARTPGGISIVHQWTEMDDTAITDTMVTIENLTTGTSYEVQVRATNSSGTTGWSDSGTGTPTEPDTNNPPEFDAPSTARSVPENASAGTPIGEPVAATDADNDTLTYSLEGPDDASFDIEAATGQLLTEVALDAGTKSTYTVTVVASDGTDEDRITVTITVTVINAPPVFSEGTITTRSVPENASAGTPIGDPVAATDEDSGDTLTYSLEGTDAASFDITPETGQITTRAALDAGTKSTYTVTVVVSDGTDEDRITVTITVTVINAPPVFSEGTITTRSVPENASAGTPIGDPVAATDADNDTLTYSLEGPDDASFDIEAATGQLLTEVALDAATKSTYTVTVVASDPSDASARITVTITVTSVQDSCGVQGAVNPANIDLASDCEALLDARDVLVGLGGPLNWSASTPIAQWDGVTVDGTSMRVTTLDLRKMRLKGMISSHLSRVTALRELYLQNNHLTGPMPSELGSMTALTHLYAGNNDLSGAIPSQMGSMTELRELRLRSNDLSGPLPAALGSLTNLTYLLLSDNDLSGSIPSQIGDMSSLYWLDVGQNNISGTLPAELGNLSQLRRLYVYENDLKGSIPSTLGNLTGLTHIVAQENDLSGSIPVQLGNMSALVWMGLYDNDLSGAIPTQLSRLSNLQRLYLSNNDLTGTIPRELGQLSALTNLWLDDNGLSGTIPSELDQLTNLVRWRMRGNDFTGCVPAGLAAVRSTDFDQLGLPACSGS